MTPAPQISVQELQQRIAARNTGADDFVILDVREAFELEIAQLPDVTHIPLDELLATQGQQLIAEVGDREVFVLCRSGGRSDQAAQFLQHQGVRAANISGGILAWSTQIDSSIPTY